MKPTGDMPPGERRELNELVDRIQHLKQEHGPLLDKISGDAGMSAELRRELLDHLEEEEAEVISQMAAIAPQVASRYRPGAAGPAISARIKPLGGPAPAPVERESKLTVGSLRPDGRAEPPRAAAQAAVTAPEPPPVQPSGGAVARRARLAIGSLRSR
jgi:hypothetical protein